MVGDRRDTSELIRPAGGEPCGEAARTYPLGKGQVICIDAIEMLPDVVLDGGQVLAGGPNSVNRLRRFVYQRVLAKALADSGLLDPVRVVADKASEADPDALYGLDWRCAEVNGAYVLATLPYGQKPSGAARVVTSRPVRRIVDLIAQKAIAPDALTIADGPNLFRVELEK